MIDTLNSLEELFDGGFHVLPHLADKPIEDLIGHLPIMPNPQTPSEITVTIKDDEKTLRAKYLIYEEYKISSDDETIKRCIAETLKSFEGEPSDVRIRIAFSL